MPAKSIYCVGTLGQDPASVITADSIERLCELVSLMPPGRYVISRDGEYYGIACSEPDGRWWLESRELCAGPGYLIC